VIFSEFFEHSV